MFEKEDYRKYLSVDNGNGLLINSNDAYILDSYGIRKFGIVNSFDENISIKEKILKNNKDKIEWFEIERIGNKYDDNYDSELDDLEEVLTHLM